MKTIRLFAFFILGVLTFSAGAQKYTVEDVKKAIAEINEELPEVIDENLTLTSVNYGETDIVMNFKTNSSDGVIEVMNSMKEEMGKMMLETLMADDDEFIEICKETKSNLKIVFRNQNGKIASLPISYKDM